jgi:predicted aspartyl protease
MTLIATEMKIKIFGLPLGDSGLYYIATNIFTPFCQPKIIPLVVDTGTSHTTLNPKGAYYLGITTTVMDMLSTEGAITATGVGHYALLHDCTLEFLTSIEQRHSETVKVIHVSKLPLRLDNDKVPSLLGMDVLQHYKISFPDNHVLLEKDVD